MVNLLPVGSRVITPGDEPNQGGVISLVSMVVSEVNLSSHRAAFNRLNR